LIGPLQTGRLYKIRYETLDGAIQLVTHRNCRWPGSNRGQNHFRKAQCFSVDIEPLMWKELFHLSGILLFSELSPERRGRKMKKIDEVWRHRLYFVFLPNLSTLSVSFIFLLLSPSSSFFSPETR
jgi:hypothetical protein